MATESKKETTKRSAHFYVKTMERTIEFGAEYVARREGERGVGEEREEREGKCLAIDRESELEERKREAGREKEREGKRWEVGQAEGEVDEGGRETWRCLCVCVCTMCCGGVRERSDKKIPFS